MKLWIAAAYCYEEAEVYGVFDSEAKAREVATRRAQASFAHFEAAGGHGGVPCVYACELGVEYLNGLQSTDDTQWGEE